VRGAEAPARSPFSMSLPSTNHWRGPGATAVARHRDRAGGRGRTGGMSRLLAAVAGLLISSALAAPAAGAKDEYWTQICGQSGCKIVKDRFVAAALTSEAEEHGSRVRRASGVPAYTVRYAVPNSGKPTGPTYWLTTDAIEFMIRNSQASVSDLFVRARAGVRPFPAANVHRAGSWERFVALGGAVSVIVVAALLLYRRGGVRQDPHDTRSSCRLFRQNATATHLDTSRANDCLPAAVRRPRSTYPLCRRVDARARRVG
jgi:hypothetical protein